MKFLKGIIAVTSLFVLASSVQAVDHSRYNGNVCKPYYGYNSNKIHSLYNGSYNNSATSTYVSCPIVADAVSPTTGTYNTYIYYKGTGQIRCALKSLNPNGTAIQTRLGARVGTGWLTVPALSSENYWGSFSLYCNVPSKGKIVTIAFTEK